MTVACGGSSTMSTSSQGTPAGAYKITVTGTSGFPAALRDRDADSSLRTNREPAVLRVPLS